MSDKFQISDDFAAYEVETQSAVAEAAKAEKRVSGLNIPVGTTGKAFIANIVFGKSKDKENPQTKQPIKGGPMITVEMVALEPTQWAGQKSNSYFTLSPTAKSTVAQQWARFYDAMDDMGMPKELRGGKAADIVKWCAAERRVFNYEVKKRWNDETQRDMVPTGTDNAKMPGIEDLELVGNAPVWKVGDKATVSGNAVEVTKLLENGQVVVKFDATGAEMPVMPNNMTPVA